VTVRRVVPLLLGTQVLDRCIALSDWPRGKDHDRIPIPAFLIETTAGMRVLWDTGTDPAAVAADPIFDADFPPPEITSEDTLDSRLAGVGTRLDDIDIVCVSHLMVDHAGGLRQLAGREVVVQRAELDYALGDPDPRCYRRADYDDPDLAVRWRIVDGDHRLVPGITLVSTPGHSPGHQSCLAELESGRTVLLASDAGDLEENFRRGVAPGILLGGREAAMQSLRRLVDLARRYRALLVPGHDPAAWARLPAEIL
jgi:N-acyl homoserine lactone hydrolase